MHARIEALEAHRDMIDASVRDLEAWSTELARRLGDLEAQRLDEIARQLVEASRTLPGMVDLELKRLDGGPAGTVLGFSGTDAPASSDTAYLSFENTFRGSEELIASRQRVYVELLAGHAPVLDIGCGRGELLELLRDAGIAASGVDLDSAMVQHSRAKGLDVRQDDAVTALTAAEDRSLGAVIANQVIEHLPHDELLELFRVAPVKLRAGGVFIVETINPHAPQALKTFWVDLSHRHPIFPEVVLALCRQSGFASAYVFHPDASGDAERDRFEAGDYAVVARVAGGE